MTGVTEAVAAYRWCPFARTTASQGGHGATVNRQFGGGDGQSDCMCLASACMAWRWLDAPLSPPNEDMRRGFCGMAGSVGA